MFDIVFVNCFVWSLIDYWLSVTRLLLGCMSQARYLQAITVNVWSFNLLAWQIIMFYPKQHRLWGQDVPFWSSNLFTSCYFLSFSWHSSFRSEWQKYYLYHQESLRVSRWQENCESMTIKFHGRPFDLQISRVHWIGVLFSQSLENRHSLYSHCFSVNVLFLKIRCIYLISGLFDGLRSMAI